MISLFRKIRQKLLTENRVTRYLVYAVGEIFLVVIGILIALQVNNWNEERKRNSNFLATIEQIYNGLELESQELDYVIQNLTQQQDLAAILFNNPDSISMEEVLGTLFYLETDPKDFHSSIGFHFQRLIVNPEDNNENLLARKLTNYLGRSDLVFRKSEKPISAILTKEGFASISPSFGYSLFMGLFNLTGNFQPEEFLKAKDLVSTQEMRTALVQIAQAKEFQKTEMSQLLDLGKNGMKQIKESYPDIRLLYENIGIIGEGTSFGDWSNDTPLKLVDRDKSIWEGVVTLKGGPLKIRENESWIVNWGGSSFPKGNLEWFGQDIQSVAGEYRLVIDMTLKTYEFFPISK
ncbi:DUF6090 family protein [Algoriphagus yeomjeoni]|nr:DUF6090 family protein [Algoriphagus yeomjeoni]